MSRPAEDGSLGNLTPDQEAKLRQAWIHLLRLCGHTIPESLAAQHPDQSPRFRQQLNGDNNSAATSNEGKGPHTPDGFRAALWRFIVNDHPDATVLRFLRARKWDVALATDMLVSAIGWRDRTRVDATIVREGDSVGLAEKPSQTDKEFLDQWRSGKSYARRTDRAGRPIYIGRVRMHDPNKQGPEAMERYILHSIESLRLLTRAPADKACLIFDMAGFGLKNMDYHVVKFLGHVFESRYPETLGVVVVHNAPFVFWGVWNVVKRWIDPNVVAKISFTKTKADLLEFVSEENLQKEYGGKDDWLYEYVEPKVGENERLGQVETEAELQAVRDGHTRAFEQLTLDWILAHQQPNGGGDKETERNAAAEHLQDSYWDLDPYIRARTYYHRVGILDDQTGKVNFEASP